MTQTNVDIFPFGNLSGVTARACRRIQAMYGHALAIIRDSETLANLPYDDIDVGFSGQ